MIVSINKTIKNDYSGLRVNVTLRPECNMLKPQSVD